MIDWMKETHLGNFGMMPYQILNDLKRCLIRIKFQDLVKFLDWRISLVALGLPPYLGSETLFWYKK